MPVGQIKTVKQPDGSTVYHVKETIEGQALLQEFRTRQQAQAYINYIKEIEG